MLLFNCPTWWCGDSTVVVALKFTIVYSLQHHELDRLSRKEVAKHRTRIKHANKEQSLYKGVFKMLSILSICL